MTSKKQIIREELEKVLLNEEKPSIYFEELKNKNSLDEYFPEIKALIGVVQSPIHHPEGDVFVHTMMVVDEAAKLRDKAKNQFGFMPGRSTIEAIFLLRRLMEKYREKKKDLHMVLT